MVRSQYGYVRSENAGLGLVILTRKFFCCYQSRHRRRFIAIQRVSVLDWESCAARAQHGLFLPQPVALRALLRRERRALLALPGRMGHHAAAPGAEPLPRHVPHGRAHAHRRCHDGAARAVRLWRTRVPLYALGVLVGRRRTVRTMLLGRRLSHVRPSPSPPDTRSPDMTWQDHRAATHALRYDDALAPPRRHAHRRVLRRRRARTGALSVPSIRPPVHYPTPRS